MSCDVCIRGDRHGEQGSALLIVFLFAAFIAIGLLMELPIVFTEAKREQEQLLMDRAQEYKQGIKVFYHKFRTYPTELKQLEDTNRMRFIRRRFKDPITKSTDWRLIHVAGPTGIPIDSKVTPPPSQNPKDAKNIGSSNMGQSIFGQGGSNQGTQNQQGASTSFSAAMTGAAPANTAGGQRNSASGSSPNGAAAGSDQNQTQQDQTQQNAAANSNEGATPPPADPNAENTDPSQQDQTAGDSTIRKAGRRDPAERRPGAAADGTGTQSGQDASTSSGTGESSSSAFGTANRSFGNQGPGGTGSAFGGAAKSGMIGGVATTASGKTIKVYQDQTDLEKWEFIYKPGEETVVGLPGNQQNPNQQNQNQNRQNNTGFSSQSPR